MLLKTLFLAVREFFIYISCLHFTAAMIAEVVGVAQSHHSHQTGHYLLSTIYYLASKIIESKRKLISTWPHHWPKQ